MNNLIIGIAGGSGSGKTTLALRLKERFGEDEVRLISHDSYYKRHDELPFEERCKLNYDHPDAFDNALLIYHLQELKAGRAIDCPVYDYSNHNRSNEVQHIEPAPVLIVEGILPFVEPELCALFDYKIFVDTDADERIVCRAIDGDIAILAKHGDYCTALGMGEAHIVDADGQRRRAACMGGLLSVLDGDVRLVATTWEWAEDIDQARAEASKKRAEEILARKNLNDREYELAQARLKRALVRTSVR